MFLVAAGLIAINGYPLLGLLLVIIYVGAIAILFLFIIFLLNLRSLEGERRRKSQLLALTFINLPLVYMLGAGLEKSVVGDVTIPALIEKPSQLTPLGLVYLSSSFWVLGIILLVSLVGVIIITKQDRLANQPTIVKQKI